MGYSTLSSESPDLENTCPHTGLLSVSHGPCNFFSRACPEPSFPESPSPEIPAFFDLLKFDPTLLIHVSEYWHFSSKDRMCSYIFMHYLTNVCLPYSNVSYNRAGLLCSPSISSIHHSIYQAQSRNIMNGGGGIMVPKLSVVKEINIQRLYSLVDP